MHAEPTCPSWRIPDGLWARMEPFLPKYDTSSLGGRPRLELRKVADGIFYVLRTGCQWKAAPREFGSGSSLHRYFQEWAQTVPSSSPGRWRACLMGCDPVRAPSKQRFSGHANPAQPTTQSGIDNGIGCPTLP
jgi:hypothetical protein